MTPSRIVALKGKFGTVGAEVRFGVIAAKGELTDIQKVTFLRCRCSGEEDNCERQGKEMASKDFVIHGSKLRHIRIFVPYATQ